jgi:GGDEF domain-containing protein
MLRLNRYILALVLWLTFFFNIERLDLNIGTPDVFNISYSVYIAAVAMVVIGLILPQWRRRSIWLVEVIALLGFVIASSINDRPAWGGGYTYLSLFELVAVMVTATLASMVGRLTADFIDTVRSLIFTDAEGRVYDIQEAQSIIKREMQYTRRVNRPLSIMMIEADSTGPRANLQATAQEIQRLLAKRYSLMALSRLMARTLRRTDFILEQAHEGRLVLVAPEMRKEQTDAIIERLNEQAQRRLGISLRSGVASFPDEGVTFEELLYQAEQDLHPSEAERRSSDSSEQHESTTEKLAVIERPAVLEPSAEARSV